MKRPIKILGSGPAGLTAAINLVHNDYQVDLFEKRADTGKRFHGDLQGLDNWSGPQDVLTELQQMNIDINFDCDPFYKFIITNGDKSRMAQRENPIYYLVKRGPMAGSFDQGLKAQALDAGVRIHFEQTLPQTAVDIVATGPISQEIFAVDKGIIFETDYEDISVALVNDNAAYKGYAYLLITKGYGCLCTVLFDRFKAVHTNYEVAQQMLTEMYPFNIKAPKQVGGVFGFSTQNIFRKNDSLYVGEAAGIQDLFYAFGIRTAMQSGYLAAQAIIQGHDYALTAQSFFEERLKAVLVSRFLWETVRFHNYALVVNEQLHKHSKGSSDLANFYKFGPLHKLLYPLALFAMRRRYPNLRL